MKEREQLEEAVNDGDVARVLKIVAASPISSRLAWEAVQEAVEVNREEVIDALLPSLLPTQSAFPLAVAASRAQVSILRKLIPVSNPRADESLALSWAARRGSVEAVEALVPFTDPLASDSNALVHAAREGRQA
ncbi:ankyrin repeat domain-containing protein [Stenotrophomonas maltophilia]|uniref:ankyrin repeat domain-containing protein n=1 Tax=Stenotrophomonas maltophilia TaxID=40324 RepID=UPI001FA6D258|nr:ankyrin repeat domain-containing protein [Stenotrophomonas maltophilia]